jgi:hypothetical protein
VAGAAAEEDDPVLDEIVAEGTDRSTWTARLHRDRIVVTDGTQAFTYTRDEIASAAPIRLYDHIADLRLPGWRRALGFKPKPLAALRQWMGPALAAWASAETRREGFLSSLIGVVTLLVSIFHEGWVLFAFGELTLATYLGRHFAPGRWIYLASAGRTLVTMGVAIADVTAARITGWWLLFAVMLITFLVADLRRYRFFAPVSSPAEVLD